MAICLQVDDPKASQLHFNAEQPTFKVNANSKI